MDYRTILDEIESWPIADRLRLVQEVWERLPSQDDEPGLTEELKAEFDRRIEELDRNPDAGVTWDEVKARVLGQLRG